MSGLVSGRLDHMLPSADFEKFLFVAQGAKFSVNQLDWRVVSHYEDF
jgi:hypothetical protein